jgi:hypothetical protein
MKSELVGRLRQRSALRQECLRQYLQLEFWVPRGIAEQHRGRYGAHVSH